MENASSLVIGSSSGGGGGDRADGDKNKNSTNKPGIKTCILNITSAGHSPQIRPAIVICNNNFYYRYQRIKVRILDYSYLVLRF